jgi:ADP-ribose pyrophosphatase
LVKVRTDNKAFKVVSSVLEYKNPFMHVYREEVIRPTGIQKPYWVLDRGGDFSIIIPIFPDDTTILVGQYRVPTRTYLWEFSMGMVEGATPLKTAKQELCEETGYRAKKWQKIGKFYLAPGFSGQKSHVFIATELSEGESQPEEDEFIDVKRVSLTAVKKMIRVGKIIDGPTIIAFHLLEQQKMISL